MTNDKRLEIICKMVREYARADAGAHPEAFAGDPDGSKHAQAVIDGAHTCAAIDASFYSDAAKLIVETRQSMDKGARGASSAAAINRIYKNATKHGNTNAHGTFKSGEYWAICDGYSAVRVTEKPHNIPDAPGLDLLSIIPEVDGAETVTLPTVAELKTAIADLKAKHGKAWKYHTIEALPGWWCDPQKLLDLLQAMPCVTAYKPNSARSILYYKGDGGDALLMPCKPPKAS